MICSDNFIWHVSLMFQKREDLTRPRTLNIIGLSLGLVLILCPLLSAHDYWFELEGSDYVLYRGHHLIKHKGDAIVPYDPAIIQNTYCATPDGAVHTIDPPFEYPTRITGPCTALTIEMDTGHWSETWTTTHNLSKDRVSDAVVSWQALENSQLLLSWRDTPTPQPLSDGLEILLEKNPFTLKNGQKLRLLVMLKGQPRQDVTVTYDGKPRGMTGLDGRINIRIRHGGLQMITGSLKEPPLNPQKADKLLRATALFFELSEEH